MCVLVNNTLQLIEFIIIHHLCNITPVRCKMSHNIGYQKVSLQYLFWPFLLNNLVGSKLHCNELKLLMEIHSK